MKFILSGGGTGGHIYPALAIADELKKRIPNAEILFIGALERMEMQKIPENNYPIVGLPIIGLQRSLSVKNLSFPFKLLYSLYKAFRVLKKFQPDAIIGTGGYASAPTLKVAEWLKIPYFIQEQNSLAGITNQWVSKKAKKIFVAYEAMERFFPKEKLQITGNPIRNRFFLLKKEEKNQFASDFNLQPNKKTILILGGSLGAKKINELIFNNLDLFQKLNVQVLWQCGKIYWEQYKNCASETISVRPFIQEMDKAYSLADVIISRAGASSVSELCVVGKPTIFIPSPNVAEDHQTKNAQAIAEKNAAILLQEKDLETAFSPLISALIFDEEKQKTLSENIKKMAKPDATSDIVTAILEQINVKK